MSYNPVGLRKFAYTQGASASYSRRMWCYVSHEDTRLADMQVTGYFYDPESDVGIGDRLLAEGTDGCDDFVIVDMSNNALVLDRPAAIKTLQTLIVELQVAGHGVMSLTDGPDSDADLGAGWTPMDMMNEITVPERGIGLTVDSGDFSFDTYGVWEIGFSVAFSHNSVSNDSRTTYLRLYDVTDDAEVARTAIVVNRNALETSRNIVLSADILEEDLTDTFRFEIGGGDDVTTIVWETVALRAFYHGRLGTLLRSDV